MTRSGRTARIVAGHRSGTMRALDVGVIGCGTAGPAAALLLARAGHRVTVYERVPEPGPVGAGILLQPTGQAVLARLGLLERVRARAAPVERLLCARTDGRAGGRSSLRRDWRRGRARHPPRGPVRGPVRRPARRGAGRAPARLRVERIDDDGGRGAARWSARGGERARPHDLVVVADGADSALRLGAGAAGARRPQPRGARCGSSPRDPERAFAGRLYQVVDGARRMVGLLPTGSARAASEPMVSLFWSIRADRVDALARRPASARWKRGGPGAGAGAAPVVAQIADLDRACCSPRYRDVRMRRWHATGAVVLGDAAHATSPQLGQGANLALWDAHGAGRGARRPARRLTGRARRYSRARRAHLRYYQFAARWLTPLFQSDSRVGGWLRDRLLPLANRFGPTRRMMTETMAGLRRGFLRRSLRLGSASRASFAGAGNANEQPGKGGSNEPTKARAARGIARGRGGPGLGIFRRHLARRDRPWTHRGGSCGRFADRAPGCANWPARPHTERLGRLVAFSR